MGYTPVPVRSPALSHTSQAPQPLVPRWISAGYPEHAGAAPRFIPCTRSRQRYPRSYARLQHVCTGGAAYPRYPRSMPTERLNLHLVSDATGETLNSLARATVSQFEAVHIIYHRWSLVRTRFQLHRVLEGIEAEPGPVLSTVLDGGLRAELEKFCGGLGLALVNVLDPVLSMLQEEIGAQAAARPGRQYVLDADYFRRIDAMHFVLAHDDGQFYLANRGVKAANVPLVPGLPEPPGLTDPRCPVVGLTLDPPALIEIRRHRLRMIAHDGPMRHDSVEYIDQDAVKDELLWARRLCNRRGWPVVDVTRRSIEETAATVLQLMEAWHARQRTLP
jgi:regulator of PEP synthase PpsR (kinase-PPPase family)